MDWEMWPFRPSGCWTQSGDLLTPDSLMVLHPSSKSGHSNCIPQEGLLCRAPILQEEAQTVMAACSSPCSALHTAGSDTSAASVCRLLAGCELDLGSKDADTEQDLSWIQTLLAVALNAARSRHRALQAETSIQQPNQAARQRRPPGGALAPMRVSAWPANAA